MDFGPFEKVLVSSAWATFNINCSDEKWLRISNPQPTMTLQFRFSDDEDPFFIYDVLPHEEKQGFSDGLKDLRMRFVSDAPIVKAVFVGKTLFTHEQLQTFDKISSICNGTPLEKDAVALFQKAFRI